MPEAVILVIAFEPDRVEVHVQRITQLRILALGLRAEEHVGRPTAAANQDAASVDPKEPSALRRRLRCDLANPEAHGLTVRHAPARDELEREIIQRGRGAAELRGPPETRIHEVELWEAVR